MKRLLTSLFTLCAATLFAASPPYENFNTNDFSFVGTGLNRVVLVNSNGVLARFVKTNNVRFWGASPALTDNAPAFIACISAVEASGGGEVLVDPGTWNFTNKITLPNNCTNITVIGQGKGKTVLQYSGVSSNNSGQIQFFTLQPGVAASNVWFKDITLRGQTDSYTNSPWDLLVFGENVYDSGAERVEFMNAQHSGFRISANTNSLARIKVSDCDFHDIMTTNALVNDGVTNLIIANSGGGAVMIGHVKDSELSGNHFFNLGCNNFTHAIYPGEYDGLLISGNSFRGAWADISMREGCGARIEGNLFTGQDAGAIDLNGTNVIVSGNNFADSINSSIVIGGGLGAKISGNTFTVTNGAISVILFNIAAHLNAEISFNKVNYVGTANPSEFLVRCGDSTATNAIVKGNSTFNFPIAYMQAGVKPIVEYNDCYVTTMSGAYVIDMRVPGTIAHNHFYQSTEDDLANSYVASDSGDNGTNVLAYDNIIHNGPIGSSQFYQVANLGALWQNSPNVPNPKLVTNSVAPYLYQSQLRFDYNQGGTNGRLAFLLDGSDMNLVGAGGVSRIYVGTNSNVGIGTTVPLAKFQVVGNLASEPTSGTFGQLEISGATSSAKRLAIGYNTTGNYGVIQAITTGASYDDLSLNPSGGNLGIGTTSPSQKLEVTGNSLMDGYVIVSKDLQFQGTDFVGLQMHALTTSQKNALIGTLGNGLADSTLGRNQFFEGAAWHSFVRLDGDTMTGNLIVSGTVAAANGFKTYTNNAVASTAITFPATTVNWTNTFDINITLYIDTTGVTGTATSKNGQQIFAALVGDMTLLFKPGDYFSMAYTIGTPSARWEPR